jgi:hypothetical protein
MNFSKQTLIKIFSSLYIPIALLGFTLLAYAPLIFSLGFYWDDWPLIWFGHLLGTNGYLEVLAGDRPFLAGVYLFSTSILGDSPIQWHIFGLLTRWCVTLSFWWALSKLWKNRQQEVFWIATLFAVYPGFKQQPISVIYSNGYLLLIAFFLSFGFTILAFRDRKRFWLYTGLAIVLDLFCSFSTEYYFGLNLVRFVILYFLFLPQTKTFWKTIKKAIIFWLPYLASMIAFLLWRVVFFKFPTYQPETITKLSEQGLSLSYIGQLLYRVIHDSFSSGIQTWFDSFHFPLLEDFSIRSKAVFWIIFAVGIAFSLLTLFVYTRIKPEREQENNNDEPDFLKSAFWIGLSALVLAGIPYWITDLPIELQFPWDRFNLAFMAGSAIILVWIFIWLFKSKNQVKVILALFLSMAMAGDVINAITFQREWQTQKDLFWELTWRVPQLKENTTVLTFGLPLKYYSDNSLTAPLNWIYAPENHSTQIPFLFAFTDVRIGAAIPELKRNLPIHQAYRSAEFNGNTSNMVVIFYSPPGCLRVLDPSRRWDVPELPEDLNKAFYLSNVDQVLPDEDTVIPPQDIFGSGSESNWCYYFEKADLARQTENWDTIVSMWNEADSNNYTPSDPTEYLVFVEGFAHKGDWDTVDQLLSNAMLLNRNVHSHVCSQIDYLSKELSQTDEYQTALNEIRIKYECTSQ